MITLNIMHSITCDALDGQPWPPPDNATALWVIVRRANGVTLWRSVQIVQSDPPPTDAHLNFGGMQQKGISNGN